MFQFDERDAGRAVYFTVPCRVFDTTAQYKGFLKKGVLWGH